MFFVAEVNEASSQDLVAASILAESNLKKDRESTFGRKVNSGQPELNRSTKRASFTDTAVNLVAMEDLSNADIFNPRGDFLWRTQGK